MSDDIQMTIGTIVPLEKPLVALDREKLAKVYLGLAEMTNGVGAVPYNVLLPMHRYAGELLKGLRSK